MKIIKEGILPKDDEHKPIINRVECIRCKCIFEFHDGEEGTRYIIAGELEYFWIEVCPYCGRSTIHVVKNS